MNRRYCKLLSIPALILILFLLTGCEAGQTPATAGPKPSEIVLQSVEPSPTPAQATAASATPTATLAPPTATATSASTNTPTPDLTLSPPTATFQPEVLAGQADDLLGVWWIKISGEDYTIQFLPGGVYNVGGLDNLAGISSGSYEFGDSEIHFIKESVCKGPADYRVYVTKQGEKPVKLRFLLISDDGCVERKEALSGKTLKPAEP